MNVAEFNIALRAGEKFPGCPNFALKEFVRSDTATRLGIENTPDNDQQIQNGIYLCQNVLQPTRNHFGAMHVNSWLRSLLLNKAVGGSKSSIHCVGGASDVESAAGVPLPTILHWMYHNVPFTELIAEYFPHGWIHVGIIEGREHEKVLKLKDANHNYTRVDIDYIMELYG